MPLSLGQGRSNAIERLHEEFKRRIKAQTVLSSTETAAMLFLALLASGQIMSARSAAGSRSPQRPSITH
jgi:putative transposase